LACRRIGCECGAIDRAALDAGELAVAAVTITDAVQTDRTILTCDAKAHFADLPGVSVLEP
jgi:hypothetical protein